VHPAAAHTHTQCTAAEGGERDVPPYAGAVTGMELLRKICKPDTGTANTLTGVPLYALVLTDTSMCSFNCRPQTNGSQRTESIHSEAAIAGIDGTHFFTKR
jgi:hypothetical protein